MTGAYMTEKAERIKKLKELESTMLIDLDNTVHGRASRFASVYTALIDGISPALAATIILVPFFTTGMSGFGFQEAFFASLGITAIVLFALGAYLAHISEENIALNGAKMIIVGLVTAIVIIVFDSAAITH